MSASLRTPGIPEPSRSARCDRTRGTAPGLFAFPMIALLSFALLAATPDSTVDASTAAAAQQTLLHYVSPFDETADASLWSFAWADLNGDGLKDALAFSRDEDWCGSSGCTLLVLEAIPKEDQEELGPFHVAAEVAVVAGPVRLLDSRHHGWADLSVVDEDGRTVRLAFDGESYPFSPVSGTASPSEAGTVLFATAN